MKAIKKAFSPLQFYGCKIGIEKEGLRVTQQARLASSAHPVRLGSSLTHPCITTDFSESQLELITPPCDTAELALAQLSEIETFTHQQLTDDLIWSSSMPCRIDNEDEIRIAYYGDSAKGLKKTLYRRGLAHRYGKSMQIISGIHFNYSFSMQLWEALKGKRKNTDPLDVFINNNYMETIRKIQRHDWLLAYLFGASPALSASFPGVEQILQRFDQDSYFLPYATSLRLSDIGYSNNFEQYTAQRVSYKSLPDYICSMHRIVRTLHPEYANIPLVADGEQQQLNNNLLQSENEHYTSVRPKQTPLGNETILQALRRRGLQYLEIRSLDINPFIPTGIDLQQMRFMEVFLTMCLLKKLPATFVAHNIPVSYNLKLTATRGRDPSLKLNRDGKQILLRDWADGLFSQMQPIAQQLDASNDTAGYSAALNHFYQAIDNPELTPSAQILSEMNSRNESFEDFCWRHSVKNHLFYLTQSLDQDTQNHLDSLAIQSIIQQQELETGKKNPPQGTLPEEQGKSGICQSACC